MFVPRKNGYKTVQFPLISYATDLSSYFDLDFCIQFYFCYEKSAQ